MGDGDTITTLRERVRRVRGERDYAEAQLAACETVSGERAALISQLQAAAVERDAVIAALEARIVELENPEPPPPSPAPKLIVPGTGAVLWEDLGTEPNPSRVYGGQSTPFAEGYHPRGEDDPWIRLLPNECPHIPVGREEPSAMMRRFIQEAGVQSLGDRGQENTRTQAQKWSDADNPAAMPAGRKYAIYFSVRPPYEQMPYPQAAGGGNEKFTQLFQFKSHSGGSGTNLSLSATVGSDGIKLVERRNGDPVRQHIVPMEPGWARLCLVAEWSDGGWYELWNDVGGEMVQVVDRVTGVQMVNGRPKFSPGIGPYHHLDLNDGTKPGQPRFDYICDYAAVQICEYLGG